jgi:hypothetical protein
MRRPLVVSALVVWTNAAAVADGPSLTGHDLTLSADWSRSPRGTRPSSSALTLQAQVVF